MKKKLHTLVTNQQNSFFLILAILLNIGIINSQANVAINGGFETGDFTGWTQFPNGTQNIIMTNPSEGNYCAQLNNTVAASASLIKNANVGIGTLVANQEVTITFEARGTLANGGVAFAELFSELSGGGTSKSEILGGAPLALDGDPDVWKSFSFTTTLGPDVSGGVTLQLTATTGGADGSLANMFYDDVKIINGTPDPTCDDGIQNGGETGVDCGGTCEPCGTCSDGIQNGGETQIDCGGPNCAPCTGPPTIAAPTPPARPTEDVISIFSDAYTDITLDAFDFGLCDGNVPNQASAEVLIANNPTIHYLKPGCQGIDFQNNRQDASTFTNLHIDFYTDDAIVGAVFNLKLVDWAGNPTEDGSTGLELNFNGGTNPALVSGQWISLDFDLTAINAPTVIGNLTRSDVAQIHITSNLPNAWYDNLYLHKNTVLGIEDNELAGFKVFPNPTRNSWTIQTKNQDMSSIKVYDMLGKQVMSLSTDSREMEIDGTRLTSGLYFAQIKTSNGVNSVKLIKR